MSTFSIEIPCRPDALPDAMQSIREFTQSERLDELCRHHVQLIIEEMVVNVIDHGRPPDNQHIDVVLRVEAEQLLIEIRDRGRLFDPTQAQAPDTSSDIDRRPVGGLGVYLTQMLSDEISYRREHGENTLVIRKRITRD